MDGQRFGKTVHAPGHALSPSGWQQQSYGSSHPFNPTTTPLNPQDVGHIAAWAFRVTNLVLPLVLKWCSSPTHPGQFTYPSGQKSTTLTITSWGNLAPAFLTWLNFKFIL